MKKSNEKFTTNLDLLDIAECIVIITMCILGIGFTIFSIICAIGLLNSF